MLLSVLAERRLRAGQAADLGALLADLAAPPIEAVGLLGVDAFLPRKERKALAAALDGLMASPTFTAWCQGATEVGAVVLAGADDPQRAAASEGLLPGHRGDLTPRARRFASGP